MILPATFRFLELIAENNNREWFQAHKQLHDEARQNVLEFTQTLIAGLSDFDGLISPDLQAKNCVMRIYRDIRFSKDKTPYKTNFGIGISPTAKNFQGPGYYIHLEPKGSFIAGGCWMPDGEVLKAIRQEIDYNSSDFHEVVDKPSFKQYFGKPDSDDKLKTVPKGYPADHPDIEYLKLKSFTVSHALKDAELFRSNSPELLLDGFSRLYPFIQFLRNALA